ncbi:MAG: hypothetical protein ABIE23_05370 [archaeon]
MNYKLIPLILIAGIVFLMGCTQPPLGCTEEGKVCPDGSIVARTLPNCEFAPCPVKQKYFEVKLEVDAPFSTATLIFDQEGNITYEADAPKMGIGKQVGTAKITSKQFQELSKLINENNFFSFSERYEEEDLMDAIYYAITVKYTQEGESKSHKVMCYGECPREVVEIRNKLKELWGGEILEVGV